MPAPVLRAARKAFALAPFLCATLLGCSFMSGPAGFWTAYHSECLVERSSDQGPWGGSRSLRWKACGPVRFSPEDARAFAERHGWKLLDRSDFRSTVPQRQPPGPGDTEPRFRNIPSTVMRFDSGWLREDPGSNETSPAIGYVQVASDGLSMYVFHFWGNG